MRVRSALPLLVMTLLLGCGGGGDESPAPAGKARGEVRAKEAKVSANAEVAVAGTRFEKSLEKDACKLFTPDVVAKALGVPETALEEMVDGCRYKWGKSHAHLWWPKVYGDDDAASANFDRDHRPKTGADVKKDVAAVQKRLEREKKDGNEKLENVDVEQAKRVGAGIANALSAGMDYEAVEGLGDGAFWHNKERVMNIRGNEIRSYDNKLDVLVGNFSFQIELHPGEARPAKDEAIAVAKAFMAALP